MTTTDSMPPEIWLLSFRIWSTHLLWGRPVVVGLEIGWLGNGVPREPGHRLAAWPRGQRGRYDDGWWSRRDRRPVVIEIASLRTGAIWFASAVFGTIYGKPRGLWHRQRGESRFQLRIIIRTAVGSVLRGRLFLVFSSHSKDVFQTYKLQNKDIYKI